MSTIRGIQNADIASDAAIAQTKVQGEYFIKHSQIGTAAAVNEDAYIVRGATATLLRVSAALNSTVPSGDKTVIIDLHKSTGAGAFATVMSAPITLSGGNTIYTPVSGTIASAGMVTLDMLRWVITIAGSTGTAPISMVACAHLREDPS